MNEIKKELELLKSWGFETVSIDKVLEMIERTNDAEVESTEKSVINIFYPPYVKEEGVEKFFREIPMSVKSERHFSEWDFIPSTREIWYT